MVLLPAPGLFQKFSGDAVKMHPIMNANAVTIDRGP